MVDDLKEFKNKKKAKIIHEDLEQVIKVMNLSIQGLSYYSKYISVMECISVLQNNKTLLEIHQSKYKKLLEKP